MPEPGSPGDEEWMHRALQEAAAAERLGEVPVGAVIVKGREIVATGHNLTQTHGDPAMARSSS